MTGNRRSTVAVLLLMAVVPACTESGAATATKATTTGAVVPTSAAPSRVTSTTVPVPEPVPEAWRPEGAPETQGMDSDPLADLVEYVAGDNPGIDSVTVMRNGTVVLDAVFYPFPAATPHSIHSCTKSVVATLIGIAIDEGLLHGVAVPVVDVLPDAAPDPVDERKASMTVEDLLTMTTGLECRDSYLYRWEGLAEMRTSDDWAEHVLALPMREDPGTRFEYCNGSSQLLSAILTEVTGDSARVFAEDRLFGPLDITDLTWPAGPGGVSYGWGGLALRPLDVAKLGYLYLQAGVWEGEQIVSQGWVETAISRHVDAGTVFDGYGYQWWVADAGYAAAVGYGGQYLFLVPEDDLAVVFTSGLSGARSSIPENLLERYVLPAVISEDPLPDDPDGTDRLAAAVAAAAATPEPLSLPTSPVADEINGATYAFRENTGGFRWFRLDGDGDTLTLALEDGDGPIEVTMAFDGRYHVADAWGRPWAFRPEWTNDETLTIAFQIVGDAPRGDFEFVFEDDSVHMWYREVVFGTSVLATADRLSGVLVVPELAAPVIDGVVDPEEWAGAARSVMDDGTEALWLLTDDTLYVAVLGDDVGSVNLALADQAEVRILHSSAALGSALYEPIEGEWRLIDDFEWCCRSQVDQSEAEALLSAEGWLANIGYVGTPGHVEFRVDWPEEGFRAALSVIPRSGPAAFWPVGLRTEAKDALYGEREEVEAFDVERWVSVVRAAVG